MARKKKERGFDLATPAPPPAQPNQSLIDGLICLTTLAESPARLGVLELSQMLGMNRTRTHRLLKTLAHVGFARQTSDRKYVAGPAMGILAAQSLLQSDHSNHLIAPLNALESFGMTVAYGALWQRYVLYPYRRDAGEPAQHFVTISQERLYPATRSSIGHVLLAAMPEAYVRSLYEGEEIPGYPAGVDKLLAKLDEVRREGHAALTSAQTGGHASVAVPVGRPPFAAVALSGDLGRKHDEVLGALRRAAAEIAAGE